MSTFDYFKVGRFIRTEIGAHIIPLIKLVFSNNILCTLNNQL